MSIQEIQKRLREHNHYIRQMKKKVPKSLHKRKQVAKKPVKMTKKMRLMMKTLADVMKGSSPQKVSNPYLAKTMGISNSYAGYTLGLLQKAGLLKRAGTTSTRKIWFTAQGLALAEKYKGDEERAKAREPKPETMHQRIESPSDSVVGGIHRLKPAKEEVLSAPDIRVFNEVRDWIKQNMDRQQVHHRRVSPDVVSSRAIAERLGMKKKDVASCLDKLGRMHIITSYIRRGKRYYAFDSRGRKVDTSMTAREARERKAKADPFGVRMVLKAIVAHLIIDHDDECFETNIKDQNLLKSCPRTHVDTVDDVSNAITVLSGQGFVKVHNNDRGRVLVLTDKGLSAAKRFGFRAPNLGPKGNPVKDEVNSLAGFEPMNVRKEPYPYSLAFRQIHSISKGALVGRQDQVELIGTAFQHYLDHSDYLEVFYNHKGVVALKKLKSVPTGKYRDAVVDVHREGRRLSIWCPLLVKRLNKIVDVGSGMAQLAGYRRNGYLFFKVSDAEPFGNVEKRVVKN